MGAELRGVRRRIRSGQSTMKITRAMGLIATSRIMRAQPRVEAARAYADTLIERFTAGEVDEINAVFTDFVSVVRQRATAKRFCPLAVEEVERPERGPVAQYLFEPEPDALLEALLPRYIATRVFNA